MGHDFKFEEEPIRTIPNQTKESGLKGMLINTGLVKNGKQATYVLIGLIVLCIAVVLFVFLI